MAKFEDVEAFVQVMEAGSFAAAARQLAVSSPVISKRISRLESELGVSLLNRTTRHVSVTEAGTVFYEKVAGLPRQLAEARQSVGQAQARPQGLLRLSCPTSFGIMQLAPAICDLQARYPDLRVDLQLIDRPVNPVEEGFDVALQDAVDPPDSLGWRRMVMIRRIACASPDYLRRAGEPAEPAELRNHDCIHYAFLETGNRWRFFGAKRQVTVEVHPVLVTNNGALMKDAAVHGRGIAVLPTFLAAAELRSGALVPVLRGWSTGELWLSAVYPRSPFQPFKVRVLLDFLFDRFGPDPPWESRSSTCRRAASAEVQPASNESTSPRVISSAPLEAGAAPRERNRS